MASTGPAYAGRRDWIARYFDERADRWRSLTGSGPLGRIRSTVREGRRRIQDAVLSWLPDDCSGLTILDAGCGPGSFAIRLADRGATVVGVDVSGALVDVARERGDVYDGPGSVTFEVGDMAEFGREFAGRFDYVVAIDSVINYPRPELRVVLPALAGAATRGMSFTLAPRTPLLAVMHAVGKILPNTNRSPAIEPVPIGRFTRWIENEPSFGDWHVVDRHAVHRGFYVSTALHLAPRAAEAVP